MSYCNCPRNCQTFREHVGNGPQVSGEAMPTRSMVPVDNATERQWQKDSDAFTRLEREGVNLQSMDGAAAFESKAQTNVERATGRLFANPKAAEKVANGETL